ncbi:hypothetical protein [Streptomyces sp. NPDC047315]|uniref:hypothetical protein n=1 Tax=Streptomyces sp. NPDC047315 TaxID=3155142 RepID=UPI0033F1B5F2
MSETASSSRRGSRAVRAAAGSAALLALIGYVVLQQSTGSSVPGCTVRTAPGGGGPTYELSTEQAANAATISAVGTTRGLPERAVTIALATALQESTLYNIDHGDRDSLGLFQQRPSKGWGTPEQVMDPVYAAGKFYEGLEKVPGYSRLPLTVAAQKVQRSGFPQAYAKHEPNAALLAAALTGRSGASLTCTPRGGVEAAGDPARVRKELTRAFGLKAADGPADGPAEGEAGGPSGAAAEGGAGPSVLSLPVRPGALGSGEQRGWELAHWAVARAEELGIEEVVFAGRVWSAQKSDEGWRKHGSGDSAPSRADGATAAGAEVPGAGAAQESVRIRLAR